MVGTASATNWSVDGSGGADFTGIQDAINNAKEGDTIFVYSGIYYENVVVDKSVKLMGIGHPVVDANGSDSAITLTADGITLVGFNATNSGKSQSDAGINVNTSNNNITSNNVRNNGFGISLSSSSNNTITGNNASNNYYNGICLSSSSNNTITGNNVCNNWGGIWLYDSCNNNTITGNNVSSNNWDGIRLYDSSNNNTITGNVFVNDGLFVYFSYQNTVEDNTVNGKPLVYLEDVSDYKVEDAGQVIIVNCNNISIENLDLSNTCGGIALWKTENSKISNNTVCNNNRDGIRLSYSSNNSITGNNVSNSNEEGINLHSSSNNTITDNNVSNNNRGSICLYSSSNNTITGNNLSNNEEGISLYYSSNNKIYFNNFINNTANVDSYISTNIWNSPLEITYTYDGTTYKSYLGNYWDWRYTL
jgi:parallel beta-helix repeat protein